MKWIVGITLVACLFLLLSGCSTHFGDMKPDTMRAAIDNCHQNQLDVQMYQRPDKSVVSIRCLPKPDDIKNTVTIRKRTRMPVVRFLTEQVESE